MAHLKIQPPGVVGLNNTDRKTIIRVIGGDTWSFSANLYNPADISEPATPENTVVTVNVADTQFDEIIWSGGWYTGVTADKNRKGLCYVEIPRSVTQNLRRGNYMFAIRVTDLLKTKFVTEAEGSILVEYKTTSDQHSIPYKDNTSNGGTSSGGTSGGGGGGGSVSGTVSWGNVTGKPSTFPPSTHTHAWSQVTDKPSTFKPESHTHKWSQVTDKPSTFTPSAHTHKWSQVTEKPSTFTPSAHEQDWSTITGTPDEYPPEAHKHPASDIIGMPSIEVDRTLTKDGVAADAEAVGEALSFRLSKTGGTLTGGIAIAGPNSETNSIKLGSASFSPGLYTINPYGINQGGETSNPTYPFYGTNRIARLDDTVEAAKSLTAAGQTALFASSVSSTTSTTLKDRDCSVVAYSSGMTLTFTASTGLRQFEILITDCTAGGSINFPDVTYRGASDALTLEAGDNHLVFAEYAANCFFVTRSVANTITIS